MPIESSAAAVNPDDLLSGVTLAAFRDAMANLAAAVHIVTTDGPGGRAGFVASAICSVTDSPPTILICVNRQSSAYAAVRANGVVCVNTLQADQHALSAVFSQTPAAERFNHGEWLTEAGRAPALAEAIMSIDGKITNVMSVGTHDVLIVEVSAVRSNSHPGSLVYYKRRYHGIYHDGNEEG